MENQLQVVNQTEEETFSIKGFDHAQRIAKVLADSDLVPTQYKGKISNCLIALEMANRIGASPMMVMQNLHVIQGKPSWSSTFIIASLNTCGRFTNLNFRQIGEPGKDSYGYEAFAKGKKTGEELVSPAVTWEMVKSEGWLQKPGSKWKTMPELMFRYRAAAFFGRLHAPDVLMGMHTAEEILDIEPVIVPPEINKESKEIERINTLINEARDLKDLEAVKDFVKPEQMELFNQKKQTLS